MVNHSTNYTIAALFSWIEFWIETYIFGRTKFNLLCITVGVILLIFGQLMRSMAMITCGKNFSHQVMSKKSPNHELVTIGIYKYFRHPSYLGWFYWSISTQLVLCNPISFVCYTIASWTFFNSRIPNEEIILLHIYDTEYRNYAKGTIVGIPFISTAI